jgi:hypothetical protein
MTCSNFSPMNGEHIYYWEGDQDYYRWRFQLDGDILHVEGAQLGALIFSASCPVWQFAAKSRLRASRLAVAEDEQRPNGGDWVRRDAAGALLAFLFQGARIGFVGELRESLLHGVDLDVLRLRA